jgi:hypothetical protein
MKKEMYFLSHSQPMDHAKRSDLHCDSQNIAQDSGELDVVDSDEYIGWRVLRVAISFCTAELENVLSSLRTNYQCHKLRFCEKGKNEPSS